MNVPRHSVADLGTIGIAAEPECPVVYVVDAESATFGDSAFELTGTVAELEAFAHSLLSLTATERLGVAS